MNIYAAFIIKDDSELDSFKVAVDSVSKYVSGWYVVANGEKTDEIKSFTASHGGNFYTLPWRDDFSEQRNYIFSKVPKDADYIFWMDSDDILVGGENLAHICESSKRSNKNVVFFEYWYGCSFNGRPSLETFVKVDVTHHRERLIKPFTHTWKGRLHETPVPVLGLKDNYVKVSYKDIPIAVMHTKTMDSGLETMKRNQKILEIQLQDEKKKGEADPRTLLYLMKIYAELDDHLDECLVMGEEYLKKSGWDEERATCCDLMAICHNKKGDTHKAIELLHDAIREYPHYPLLYMRLARAYLLVGKPKEAKFWLEVGVSLPLEKTTAGITHVQEMKILSAQVLLQLKFQYEKDYEGALSAMEVLIKEQPNEMNTQQYYAIADIVDLQNACKKTDELFTYLDSIDQQEGIRKALDILPQGITSQPFAIEWRKKVTRPRVWASNEICYFASFFCPHLEKWDGRNLKMGIGGSETAVIELSREWVKLGYKVTVYGDPEQPCVVDGVTYLPWYYFNKADWFNIFIGWRNSSYSKEIKCKTFLCDMHDLYADAQLERKSVDTFMFKSEYHKSLSKGVTSKVISNGI